MKFRRYLVFILSVVVLISCGNNSEVPRTLTKFNFEVLGFDNGTLKHWEGRAGLECRGDEFLLSFKEAIDDKTSESDNLIGELILAFKLKDTLGTYPLKAISASERAEGAVGVVTFLNQLTFDDFAWRTRKNFDYCHRLI